MELMKLLSIPKPALWGRNKVGEYYAYEDYPADTGQTWGVAIRGEESNLILDGPYQGMTLKKLWEDHHEKFRTNKKRFPWIIGFNAPSDNLSIQVHPDQKYVDLNGIEDAGKNEAWYFHKAKDGAKIVFGHNAKNKEELENAVMNDRWDDLIRYKEVKEKNFVYVPAGKMHALGKDVLIYEIQQNSELTYRLYDYHRKDENGNERETHLRQGLDCIKTPDFDRNYPEKEEYLNGQCIRTLISNSDFELRWIDIDGELILDANNHYSIVSVLEGCALLNGKQIHAGEHLLLLGEGKMIFKGKAEIMICNEKKEEEN